MTTGEKHWYRMEPEPDEAAREAIIERMAEAMRNYAQSVGRVWVMTDAEELARAAYEASQG